MRNIVLPPGGNWIHYLLHASSVEALREPLAAYYEIPHGENGQIPRMAVIGAAVEGRRLLQLCQQQGIEVVGLYDDHPRLQGQVIQGYPIQPLQQLTSIARQTPIVIASHRVLAPMQTLHARGFTCVMPFAVLQIVQGAVFPPHAFYTDWLESVFSHRDILASLPDLLADAQSVRVLNALIGFRLTLDPEVLAPIIEWDLYGPQHVLSYSDNEVYVDGGAFDGDTIARFIDRMHGKFDKIIGFEPDTQTFRQLQQRFMQDARVTAINKGLYSHTDVLYFDNVGTRASSLTSEKTAGIEVPVTSIDEVLARERVTYIKMNIEGAEIPALRGATTAIMQHKPKLGISVYHRPTDLWEIPRLVKSLRDDYQLYLRQHDGGVIESVLYAI